MRTVETDGDEFSLENGLRGSGGIPKPERILGSEAEVEGRLLVVEPNFGFLPVRLSRDATDIRCLSRSAKSCRVTQDNLESNNVEARVNNGFYAEAEFDTAVYAPPAYEPIDTVKNRMSSLVDASRAGSEIVLCGPKNSGMKRYARFLSDCGETKKYSKSGNIVVRHRIESDLDSPDIERSFTASALNQTLDFQTCPGLFSYTELDPGTRALLQEVAPNPGEDVLDLGCGYGAVGCFLSSSTGASMTMSDDDCLATSYASANVQRNGLSGRAVVSDALHEFDASFGLVVSNPPTHAGDGVLRDMLVGAEKHVREAAE
jgi:16S rRNA (guanine1207-N2)-methyltransferase